FSAGVTGASLRAQNGKFSVGVAAPLELGEAFRRLEAGIGGFLHDDQGIRLEPSALARRTRPPRGQAFAVRRVEEQQRKCFDRMGRTEPSGVTPEDAGNAAKPERFD